MSHGDLEGCTSSTLHDRIEKRLRFTKEEDFDYAVLSDTQQKLAALMAVSGSLMDAELADQLLEFEHTLGRISKRTRNTGIEGALPQVLTAAAEKAVVLRRYLERQATKVESLEDFLNDLRKLVRNLRKNDSA